MQFQLTGHSVDQVFCGCMEVELKQVVRGSTECQATRTGSDDRFDGCFRIGRSCVVNVKRRA